MAERVGFEPTLLSQTAFRERHHQPLGHLSTGEDSKGTPEIRLRGPCRNRRETSAKPPSGALAGLCVVRRGGLWMAICRPPTARILPRFRGKELFGFVPPDPGHESQSTRELCGSEGLRDLGLHRLKDLTAPERIFQLGDRDFPPVKSLNTTNLPVAANPLVGRATELAELSEMLVDGERLVTLTGPGGSGKTRLSLQVAAEVLDDFPGGVFFVPLAPLESPELVRPAIARTVGVPDIEEIADRRALLLLDNFEHLLDAAPEVTAVLRAGHAVKVLATSRAPLRIQGECEYAVDPLPERDGVELLIQRARSIRRDFVPNPERAANVCRRLDGLPLALELAAGQLRFLDADTLVERLEQRLPLLTGGARDAPERQRTLRATIDWSFALLSDAEQRMFARLAIFVGSFSVDAAEEVTGVSRSLSRRRKSSPRQSPKRSVPSSKPAS